MLSKRGKFGAKNILALHRYRDFRVGVFYFDSLCMLLLPTQGCVIRQTYSKYGDKSFAAAGPKLWNNLPVCLQLAAHCDLLLKFHLSSFISYLLNLFYLLDL